MFNNCSCSRIDLKPKGNANIKLNAPNCACVDVEAGNAVELINKHNVNESSHPYILNQLQSKQEKINDLNSIRAGASAGLTAIQPNDNITKLNNNAGYITESVVSSSISSHDDSHTAHEYIRGLVSSETTNRENADIGLQQQIDAISASSDVKDIVGTYAALQAYDTSTLGNNDIIKVLNDETHAGETTYYRWSTTTETFTLIGEEGPYYTKSAADSEFVPQTRTVNGKALNQNISLDVEDIGITIETTEECDVNTVNEVLCEEAGEVTIEELLATISGYDETKTQTLKNINGTFYWVDD